MWGFTRHPSSGAGLVCTPILPCSDTVVVPSMISPRISSPWSFLSDWIFPIIVAQYIHEEGPHCIAEDLNRRKRPVCNGSFDDESIVVVDKDLEALDLMPIDFARPPHNRRPTTQR